MSASIVSWFTLAAMGVLGTSWVSAAGERGLLAPSEPEIQQLSELTLDVSMDVHEYLDREWDWVIDKSADKSELDLMPGASSDVNYSVKVGIKPGSPEEYDFGFAGTIKIKNPTDTTAKITSVTGSVTGNPEPIAINCPVAFPYLLEGGETLECPYESSQIDSSDRTATVVVESSGVEGDVIHADVDFADAFINRIDDCVHVTDTYAGALGDVCVEQAPETFHYARTIGPYTDAQCGAHIAMNTAEFVTNDVGATGSDSWDVAVMVACGEESCTLSQGYWKTHAKPGPAPYDDTWAKLSKGSNALFFKSGKTWYQVFWTAPAGNAYYILAHQYMAAKLNILGGASTTPAVVAALADAKSIFAAVTPGSWSGAYSKAHLIGLAKTLDKYNKGLIGPGHCDG